MVRINHAELDRVQNKAPEWLFTASFCLLLGYAVSSFGLMLAMFGISYLSLLAWISKLRLARRKRDQQWINLGIGFAASVLFVYLGPWLIGSRLEKDNPEANRHLHAATKMAGMIDIRAELRKSQNQTITAITGADSMPYVDPKIIDGELDIRIGVKGNSATRIFYYGFKDEIQSSTTTYTIRQQFDVPPSGYGLHRWPIPQESEFLKYKFHLSTAHGVYNGHASFKLINGNWERAVEFVREKDNYAYKRLVSGAYPQDKRGNPEW